MSDYLRQTTLTGGMYMPGTTDAVRRGSLTACVLLTLVCPVVGLAGERETTPPKSGDLVFQTDFDTPEEREAWSKASFAQWDTGVVPGHPLWMEQNSTRAEEVKLK